MINQVVADKLKTISVLLRLEGKQWESRAYEDARNTILGLERGIDRLYEEDGVDGLAGLSNVGETIAGNIKSYLETGRVKKLDDLQSPYPDGVESFVKLDGVGAKTVQRILNAYDVTSLADVKDLAEENKLQAVNGIGPATEKRVHDGLQDLLREGDTRFLRSQAERVLRNIVPYLQNCDAVSRCRVAGSYRRHRETVGDIDLVIKTGSMEDVVQHVREYQYSSTIEVERRTCYFTTVVDEDLPVKLHQAETWGAALQHHTGSRAHNELLEQRDEDASRPSQATEQDVYDSHGLAYIPPEIRTGDDEIHRAANDDIPELVSVEDIKGDLHMHTVWSDGENTMIEMIGEAERRGYRYVAFTDHSKGSPYAGGLSEPELEDHGQRIDSLNDEATITVLRGSEVNILPDGSLDYSDEALAGLDIVIASLHSHLDQDKDSMTNRLITAINSGQVTCLGHLTGRLIGRREPAAMDFDAVFAAAAAHDVAVEINSNPNRLDVNASLARRAVDHGCKIFINTDSHDTASLGLMKHGVGQARRAELSSDDVLNTKPLDDWV